uniref:NB-ARC domains-containing protein n=1 Tax=Tanacetum cinerariifolium TaxID=118510 RepID=A0A6L2KU56_TANCI|nr:hypothetical protein [Tanacetum cinerariifolium]
MEHISLDECMMTDCKHCDERMIKNHFMDRLLKDVLMFERVIDTVKNDMVIHTEKTGMMRLVVEIEYDGKIADVFDKETWSFDGLQPEQGKDTAFWFLRFVSCDLVLTLRFASKLVAFCFKARCVMLQDTLRFALRYTAFYFKTSYVLFQDPCVLLQDSCVLSHGGIAFCLLLKTLSAITSKDNEDPSWNTSSRSRELSRQLQLWKRFRRLHLIVFVLVRNIVNMECQSNPVQTTYPVFYDVEPTERKSLKEAVNLAGWELKKTVNGYVIADYIAPMLFESCQMNLVADISKKLSSISSSVDRELVGMEIRINKVLSSLGIGTEDVRMIVIKGIGGGGKTFLPQLFSIKYPITLKEAALLKIDQYITASIVSGGINKMVHLIHRKKVLVLLDNVNDTKQLEA